MLLLLGLTASGKEAFDSAADYFDRALVLARGLEPDIPLADHLTAMVLINRAVAAVERGELDPAFTDAQESLEIWNERGDQWGIGIPIEVLAFIALEQGAFERAVDLYRQNLPRYRDFGDLDGIANCMTGTAVIASRLGRQELAARLFGAANATRDRIHVQVARMIQKASDRAFETARSYLGERRFEAARQSGHDLSLQQAITEIMNLQLPPSPVEETLFGLTPRQLEVLRLMAEGRTDQEIADILFIGYRTVTTHVQHILRQMGLETRTAASTEAMRLGLI
jgi:DNA-binding CsgD family transcriptional regulator